MIHNVNFVPGSQVLGSWGPGPWRDGCFGAIFYEEGERFGICS